MNPLDRLVVTVPDLAIQPEAPYILAVSAGGLRNYYQISHIVTKDGILYGHRADEVVLAFPVREVAWMLVRKEAITLIPVRQAMTESAEHAKTMTEFMDGLNEKGSPAGVAAGMELAVEERRGYL